jgi:hypothetical protein
MSGLVSASHSSKRGRRALTPLTCLVQRYGSRVREPTRPQAPAVGRGGMRFIEEVGEDRGLLLASVQPFARRSFSFL